MKSYKGEIWKPCPDFESKYLVSNYGRIKSIGTHHNCKTGELIGIYKKSGRDGYMQVRLFDNGRTKTIEVHTLVAKAFIPNPLNLPMVNHKDENPSNNYYKNLEWCDNRYNIRYSRVKAVDVYTINGDFVETCEAVTDVANKYGVPTSNVSRCCNSLYGTSKGFQFRWNGEPFATRPITNYQIRKSRRGHSCNENRFVNVNVFSIDGTFIKTYENISTAAKDYGTSTSNICKCYKGEILTNKGYIFLVDFSIKDRLQKLQNRKHKSQSE